MTDIQKVLNEAGIGFEGSLDRPVLRAECARLATLLRGRRAHTLGLLPVADDVAVIAPAMLLGRALAETSPRPVGVVDVRGTWPCTAELAALASPDGTPVATSWVLESVALLSPRAAAPAASVLSFLRTVIADRGSTFGHLVVDLTGMDHLGEHIAAFDLLHAVVLVARSGRTTTRQVQDVLRQLPKERGLGVLLTGL